MDPSPPTRTTQPAVLLVEDDEALAELLKRHLERRGHPTHRCATAGAAIEALAAGLRPRLIVLDVNLPDRPGWAVTRDPAYVAAGRPPVVISSAGSVDAAALRREGATGLLPKPFPLATFMDVVERHVRPAPRPAATEEPS